MVSLVQLLLAHTRAVTDSTSTQLVYTQLSTALKSALLSGQLSKTLTGHKMLGGQSQKKCCNSNAKNTGNKQISMEKFDTRV